MDHEKDRRPTEQASQHRKTRKHSGGIAGQILFVIGTLLLIGACTAAMITGIFLKYVNTTLTPTLQVRAEEYTMKLSSVIYYQDKTSGEWMEYQNIYGVENRIWADFAQMPDALWQAAVSIEDQRFFDHHGVDWKRTAGATVKMLTGAQEMYGGSTITQQLLKNMTGDNKGTINRKVREIFRAMEFEKNYTKTEILELYLNTIALGKGCYGVQTAAEYYFGKDVSELSTAECASLIAITNNPSLYGPMSTVVVTNPETGAKKTARELNKKRQEDILWKMKEQGYIKTEEEYQAAVNEELHFTDGSTSAEDLAAAAAAEASGGENRVNSWFVEQVFKDVTNDLADTMNISADAARTLLYNGGYHIYTTLDPEIQEIAEAVYEDRSNLDVTSRKGQQLQSGITIVDPTNGNVVAMVGKVGPKEGNLVWNYAVGRRQVGSSIKPLTVYAPALDAGAVTPASTFDNYPVRLLNGNPWPKNSPNKFTGWTMLGDGVRNSINTIAVQVLEKLGVTESFAFATEKLNLSLTANDMNLSSLGLGGLTYGLNTMEMAAAYASFANEGVYNSPKMYVEVKDANGNTVLKNDGDSHAAMKETTAYLMNQMLQSVVTSGTGASAKFGGMTIAGKTGTTSDNYDRYFVGYTPYYAAAVWTGYDNNEKISYSGNPAITMWKKVMQKIHENLPDKSFSKPASGLESVKVCRDSGLLCSDACHADVRGDRAIAVTVASGTAPTETCTMHAFRDYCTEGKCLASPFCPAESVVQKGFLDYTRENYGPNIVAEDNAYLIPVVEKVLEESGCTVHTTGTVVDLENPGGESGTPELDPSDPNYQPPAPPAEGGGTSGGGGTPTTPTEPQEPTEGGGASGWQSGDWWNDLWQSPGA
ncbi:transglycosylase domain-containing protein [Oscillibacter sp.]|uniref:transglycosylase domain-containing protein n=1 Tax=Oscillibacter sp. TaxID=1945593 RepID=UPI00262B5DB7|nr:transglycosylase domain-containing protein [Oscillibacter sp.]MDD3346863.1 transglycosylase domain-containing protein [Oscillibacter sp.]